MGVFFMKKSNCTEIERRGIRQLVTEFIAAERMDVHVQTLRNHRSKGVGIPYIKFARSVRYDLADIDAYIDRHRIVPGPIPVKEK